MSVLFLAPRPRARREQRLAEDALKLFDFGFDPNPRPFTYVEAMEHLGCQRRHFFEVVHLLRLQLSEQKATVICIPAKAGEPWRYRIEDDAENARRWEKNQADHLETRIESLHAVASSRIVATDPSSLLGRQARRVERAVRRLQEDLTDLRDDVTSATG